MKSRFSKLRKDRVDEQSPDNQEPKPSLSIKSCLQMLARGSGAEDSEQAVRDYAEAVFMAQHPELLSLGADEAHVKAREDEVRAQIKDKDKILKDTAPYILTAEAARQTLRAQDKVWLVLLIVLACVALCLSAVNMSAVLFGSYDPFILDHPWVGISLSCIMPLASMSVKLFIHAFDDNDRLKSIFTKAVYGAAAGLTVVWVWLFAGEYHGMGGDADIEAMLSGGGSGLLVFVQLMLEVMVGSALVLRVSQILDLSQKQMKKRNADYDLLCEALSNLRAELEKLRARHREITTQIQKLNAMKTAFVTETLAQFAAQKSRHQYLVD